MISRPTLPPRAGYVEIETDGVRQYKKIETEQDIEINALKTAQSDTDALLVDQEYRMILLELGVQQTA